MLKRGPGRPHEAKTNVSPDYILIRNCIQDLARGLNAQDTDLSPDYIVFQNCIRDVTRGLNAQHTGKELHLNEEQVLKVRRNEPLTFRTIQSVREHVLAHTSPIPRVQQLQREFQQQSLIPAQAVGGAELPEWQSDYRAQGSVEGAELPEWQSDYRAQFPEPSGMQQLQIDAPEAIRYERTSSANYQLLLQNPAYNDVSDTGIENIAEFNNLNYYYRPDHLFATTDAYIDNVLGTFLTDSDVIALGTALRNDTAPETEALRRWLLTPRSDDEGRPLDNAIDNAIRSRGLEGQIAGRDDTHSQASSFSVRKQLAGLHTQGDDSQGGRSGVYIFKNDLQALVDQPENLAALLRVQSFIVDKDNLTQGLLREAVRDLQHDGPRLAVILKAMQRSPINDAVNKSSKLIGIQQLINTFQSRRPQTSASYYDVPGTSTSQGGSAMNAGNVQPPSGDGDLVQVRVKDSGVQGGFTWVWVPRTQAAGSQTHASMMPTTATPYASPGGYTPVYDPASGIEQQEGYRGSSGYPASTGTLGYGYQGHGQGASMQQQWQMSAATSTLGFKEQDVVYPGGWAAHASTARPSEVVVSNTPAPEDDLSWLSDPQPYGGGQNVQGSSAASYAEAPPTHIEVPHLVYVPGPTGHGTGQQQGQGGFSSPLQPIQRPPAPSGTTQQEASDQGRSSQGGGGRWKGHPQQPHHHHRR